MQPHHSALDPHDRLSKLIALERSDLWTILAFGIGAGVMSLATPIAIQSLVNTIAFGALIQPLVVLAAVLFISLAFNNVLVACQFYVVEMMQRRVFVRLLGQIAVRLHRVLKETFDGHNGPELVNRFFDVLTVQKASASLLLDGLTYALQALIGMVLLAFYHPLLLAFDVVLVAAALFIFLVLGRHGIPSAIAESKAKYAAAAWLEEIARLPDLAKWAGGEVFIRSRSDAAARDYLDTSATHFGVVMSQNIGLLALHTIANTALLGLGGWMVIERQLSLGQLIAAELVVNTLLGGLSRLGKSLQNYYQLMAATDKLGHLLDLPRERGGGEALPAANRPAHLKLTEVAYAYAGREPIFTGINAELLPGQHVALLGHSGSGRATLLDLLAGLRPPSAGSVEVNGFDLRDLSLEDWRRHMALAKYGEVAEASIYENLRMGRDSVGMTEARDALAAVDLLSVVASLPAGLNTPLATHGGPLSAEQCRRLMLARAIAAKPRLLLIYELLDGLDPSVAPTVTTRLLRPDAPWSAVVVTHSDAVSRWCPARWTLSDGGLLQTAREAAA